MPVSAPELMSELASIEGKSATECLQVPVAWSNTSFGCEIKTLAQSREASDSELVAREPVRLRVNESSAGSCRVELFCAATFLCRASAGC
jgi:hypothetical protein